MQFNDGQASPGQSGAPNASPADRIHGHHHSMGKYWCCSCHCICSHDGRCYRRLHNRSTFHSSSWMRHMGMTRCNPWLDRSRRGCTPAKVLVDCGDAVTRTRGRFAVAHWPSAQQVQKRPACSRKSASSSTVHRRSCSSNSIRRVRTAELPNIALRLWQTSTNRFKMRVLEHCVGRSIRTRRFRLRRVGALRLQADRKSRGSLSLSSSPPSVDSSRPCLVSQACTSLHCRPCTNGASRHAFGPIHSLQVSSACVSTAVNSATVTARSAVACARKTTTNWNPCPVQPGRTCSNNEPH